MRTGKFPYSTYIDRVITDEHHNIIFGDKAGNVYDTINDDNQKQMLVKLQEQITNQQKQIVHQETQITNQESQINLQGIQIGKMTTQIENQEIALGRLLTLVTAISEINTKQSTSLDNQQAIITRLEKTFKVEFNGNVMELYGKSTDVKPTTGIKIGTTFFEVNTSKVYMWSGSSWILV